MLYDHQDDSQMIFEGFYQFVVSNAFIVRLWNEIWNRDKFRHLYETMNNHWDIFTNELEVRILKNYSNISRKFTIFYSTMMYLLSSMFIVIPLTPVFLDIILPLNESRPRILAIEVELKVDTDEYFVPIFLYTTAIIVIGISIMVGVDTMHFTCTTHACSLFSIVGEEIENITSTQYLQKCKCGLNKHHELSREQMIYQQYVTCLRKYQLALKFVDILNSTHQTAAIFFLLLIGASLSLTGVRVVYVLDQLEEMIRFLFIIMGALMQLLIMCYAGQKLMDESQNVFHRAYAAEWYLFSPRLKSLLIITLYRSLVPCSLTVGKFFPLSMSTYATIITLCIHRRNGKMVFECLYQIVISTAFLIKLLNQIWNRNKFRRLYESMEDHWNIFSNDVEVQVLRNYSYISHKFTLFYSILTYTMMSMFIIIPSIGPMLLDILLPLNKSRPRNVAIYSEYGVDKDKYFVPIFLYTSLIIIFGMAIFVSVDSMHIACTAHACSLFQLIGYVNILNDTHKIVGFCFLLTIGAVFSLVGIRIFYVLDQVEELLRFAFIIMGALLQLIILCYSGQKLMDESQNIFQRAYAAEWYKFSPRLKSLLIITLYRSIVPSKLTAGNIFPLSMSVFAMVSIRESKKIIYSMQEMIHTFLITLRWCEQVYLTSRHSYHYKID
ncbi:uncharacterized protein LOC105837982 isoform X2 [Monomorium pharaonis]|uniref:uncharacterized protein LOC105837982 isoform X2 n=1 Tax=Monomorium pharaonis TaxID=307658 RepID=UPI00174638E2|nr:uncharacterized protein LOC105837982 isoform X2 [Monomorium pharaonis]